MKKTLALLSVSALAVLSLASCGETSSAETTSVETTSSYTDSYSNYLAALDATKASKNLTLKAEVIRDGVSLGTEEDYYTYYQYDSVSKSATSDDAAYIGIIISDKYYNYSGTSLDNLKVTYTTTSLSKEELALVTYNSAIPTILNYDVVSTEDFYKSLSFDGKQTYTLNTSTSLFDAWTVTISDGMISEYKNEKDGLAKDITFCDFGTTKALSIDVSNATSLADVTIPDIEITSDETLTLTIPDIDISISGYDPTITIPDFDISMPTE